MQVRAQTSNGVVLGQLRDHERAPLAVYLGIPYAAAPVGRLRFAAPEPAPAWSGEREAFAFGPAQPQHDSPHQALLGLSAQQPQAEDCLSLNVWTPRCSAADAGGRPVLVWIHGGGFISGTSGVEVFDGSALSRRGDIVVVTVNYRVGALGFMALDRARCNFGLRDQLAALAWVRDNIASFGGDPGRVTVFGGSAGAGSVCALLACPAARELVHGAIVQSGAPEGLLSVDEAEERTQKMFELLAKAGHPGGEQALASLPLDVLLTAQARLAGERQWKTGMLFPPVVDGELLPRRLLHAAHAGGFAPVPLLIGTNRDELQLFKYGVPALELGPEAVKAMISQTVPGIDVEAIYAAFLRARSERGESVAGMDMLLAIQTELALRLPSIALASLHGGIHPNTFMYLFDWPSPAHEGALGAFHGLEQAFVFGTLAAPGVCALAGEGAAALSSLMMDSWIAFARTGSPATPSLGEWPGYESTLRQTMCFGARARLESDPLAAERSVLAAALGPG